MNAAIQPGAANTGDNLPSLVLARALANPARAVMRRKHLGVWRPTVGSQLTRDVAYCAAGLIALGLKAGENVGLLAAPSPEWVIADLAVQCAGGVSAGFHAESAPGELFALVGACEPRILFVDSAAALDRALDLRDATAGIQHIVCFDPQTAADVGEACVLSLAELTEKGATSSVRDAAPWIGLAAGVEAVIIPTSGASGPSRGARLTHRALRAAVDASLSMIDLHEGDERLSLMQASHVFERVFGLYACLAAGVIVNFPESVDTIPENMRELQPQVISGPPALWNRFHAAMTLASVESTPFQRKLFETALKSGGGLADLFVLKKVRRDFGLGRVRVALSSGGPLRADVHASLAALGVRIQDVYALAETGGPAAIARDKPRLFETARGVVIRIEDQGRVLVKAAAACSAYVGAGDRAGEWTHGGDIGVTSGDAGFALTGSADSVAWDVEEAISASPYVSACIVTGDVRENLSAIVLIDYDQVVRYAQARSTPFTHYKSLAEADDIRNLFEQEIARVNASIAPARIAAFTIANRQIGPGDPELGPAMGLRRRIALRTLTTG